MNGIVFDVQRYSIHDGPGIRTVVFLKGCPLRCPWCSNPESQLGAPEVEYRGQLCQHCGRCLEACPLGAVNQDLFTPPETKIDRRRCENCGLCAEACPTGAMRRVGQVRSVDEVVADVRRDAAFYRRSGGGVTLSGGEPMAQPTFAADVLRACYESNIHTALETTGCVSWPLYQAVQPFTELFLFDLKHMDSETHRRLTGIPNDTILQNARRLAGEGATVVLRVPLIPGHNLDADNLRATADFAVSVGVREVHLMPFHQLGKGKYSRLGRDYTLGDLAGLHDTCDGREQIRWAREIMVQRGLTVYVGG